MGIQDNKLEEKGVCDHVNFLSLSLRFSICWY